MRSQDGIVQTHEYIEMTSHHGLRADDALHELMDDVTNSSSRRRLAVEVKVLDYVNALQSRLCTSRHLLNSG